MAANYDSRQPVIRDPLHRISLKNSIVLEMIMFLISNFRRVLYVVYFLLGNSPASEFYMPTFRNTLSVQSSKAGRYRMTKFENSWGSQQEKFWLENSLTQ